MADRYRQRGLTLVELLVVAAIVALLLAIVLPALGAARAAADATRCQSNLKQLAMAQIGYAVHAGRYTPMWSAGSTEPSSALADFLAGEVGDFADHQAVFNCPLADREELARFAADDPTRAVGSYGMNPGMPMSSWQYDPDRVPAPSRYVLVGEMPVEQSALGYTADGFTSTPDGLWLDVVGHTPERGYRHREPGGHFAFNDGHVAFLDPVAMRIESRPYQRFSVGVDPKASRWIWWNLFDRDDARPAGCQCGFN